MLRKLTLTAVLSAALGGAAGQEAQAKSEEYGTGLTQIRYANAYCESGGDPYNKRNSKYRGKWQFDQQTWNAYAPSWLDWDGINGHRNDPATVPERHQDRVALRVPYDAWPNC